MGSSASVERKEIDANQSASELNYQSVSENLMSEETSERKYGGEIHDEYKTHDRICDTEDTIAELSQVIDIIHNILILRDEKTFQNCLNTLSIIYRAKDNSLKYDENTQYRREVGRQLVEKKTTRKICRVIVDIWFEDYINKEGDSVIRRRDLMLQALSTLNSYCDCVPEVALDVAGETDFLETLKEILEFVPAGNIEREKLLSLCIIHNVAKVDENVSRIRSLTVVDTLCSYLEGNNNTYRLIALAALANIINEEESAILQNKHDLVKLLLNGLTLALDDEKSHQWTDEIKMNWSAQELARTVRFLATTDANKQLLVNNGSLYPLSNLVKKGTLDEQREAVGAICVLAYDEENQNKIIKYDNPDIVRLLYNLIENSTDINIKWDADCTLWTLLEQLYTCEKYNDIAYSYKERLKQFEMPEKKEGIHKGPETNKKGHIMISYNKQHRELMQKIKEKLQERKYDVWMDVDDIRRYSYDAMAKAVESAHIVLICMSQAYKGSTFCRKEAKYACKRDKRIVPLLMVNGYDPDGWLGLIVEDLIHYDFGGKYKFESKFEDLVKEIQKLYEEDDDNDDNGASTVTPGHVSQSTMKESISDLRQWNSNHVDNWIKKHTLLGEEVGKLTGRDLAGLIVMREKAPEHFYRCLEEKLKIKSISTIDMFIEALDTLIT